MRTGGIAGYLQPDVESAIFGPKAREGRSPMKFFGLCFLTILGLLAVFGLIEQNLPPEPPKAPYGDRVAAACQAQFGVQGRDAVNKCRMTLMWRRAAEEVTEQRKQSNEQFDR